MRYEGDVRYPSSTLSLSLIAWTPGVKTFDFGSLRFQLEKLGIFGVIWSQQKESGSLYN